MNDMNTGAPAPTYKADFYAWTQDQGARLRALKPPSLDWEKVAAEVEGLGQAERTNLESDLTLILTQLLKLRHLRAHATLGWRTSTTESRRRVAEAARRSPSLKQHPADILAAQYPVARERAAQDAGLLTTNLPPVCPFTIRQVLDQEYWPEQVEE